MPGAEQGLIGQVAAAGLETGPEAGPDIGPAGALTVILQAGFGLIAAPPDRLEGVIAQGLARIGAVLSCRLQLEQGPARSLASKPLPSGPGFEIRAGEARLRVVSEHGTAFAPPPGVTEAMGDYLRAICDARARAATMRETERALQSAQGRVNRRDMLLRGLFDLSPIGVLLIDQDSGAILDANAAFLSFGRWAQGDVVGRPLDALLPGQARLLRKAAMQQLRRDQRFGPIENVFERPDGTCFPAVVRGIALPEAVGQRIIWVLVEDISVYRDGLAQVKAHRDEALRAQAELAAALEALPHGLVIFDAEDRVVLCNDNMRAIFKGMDDLFVSGARHVDILTEAVARGMFPEAHGREAAFIAAVEADRRKRRFERLAELKDGRLVRIIEVAIPSGGRIGLRIDVTEEHETARRLADVIEGSQAGTWEVDLETGRNIVNDRWAEMLGWTRAQLDPITSETWRSLIHPLDKAQVVASVDRMLGGAVNHYEHTYRMRHADGHWVWINDRGRISAWNAEGRPSRMAGVHVDISVLKETEQRLEDIIDGAEVGTWQFNTRTGENRINDRWAEMLGYRRHEIEPMNALAWKALVHPDDFAVLVEQEETSLRDGLSRFRNEIRLRHKDGHWVWILSRGRVTSWDGDGAPLIMSGVHLDISKRKQLEIAFRAERDFLAQLMETSVSGIMAVDDEGRVIFCNAEVSRQFGVPIEAMQGQICDPVLLGLTSDSGQQIGLDEMPCQLCLKSQSGLLRDMRLRLTHKDGRRRVLSINAARTKDPVQKARVVLTVTDITDAAEAEERLRLATERAEAANHAKSQFLANMSHELRTPLNGVLGMAELLTGHEDADERSQMVATIRDSAAHLLSIVNDILDLAKVESGNLALATEAIDLRDLGAKVLGMHRIVADAKGIGLEVQVDEALDRPRLGDRQRVLQIMHNIVGNALKFTAAGRVRLRIQARVPGQVRLVCTDTGIGMSADEMARVFDEFTQADGTITRRFGGTGLGLSIVRRLVTLMQGQITLNSEKGRGTEVIIDLPMAEISGGRSAGTAAPATEIGPLRGLRALVAEDNATNQIILRAMLARLGISAIFADDGAQAVAIWEPGRFDVLLLDISMPGKDGVTALRDLQEKAGLAGLPPAIAVTANAMTHHVESYRQSGFSAVVAKPIGLDDLARSIAEAVQAGSDAAR